MHIPTLVLIGGRGVQIDAHADGNPLQSAAVGKNDVTFAFPSQANARARRPSCTIASSR